MVFRSYLECIYKKSAEFISDNTLIRLFFNIHSAKCYDHW